jgi:hypothetical protein
MIDDEGGRQAAAHLRWLPGREGAGATGLEFGKREAGAVG